MTRADILANNQDFHLDDPSDPRDYDLIEIDLDGGPYGSDEPPYVVDDFVQEVVLGGPPDEGEWVAENLDLVGVASGEEGRFGWEPEEQAEKEEPDWDGDNVPDAVGEERLNRFEYPVEGAARSNGEGSQEVFAAK